MLLFYVLKHYLTCCVLVLYTDSLVLFRICYFFEWHTQPDLTASNSTLSCFIPYLLLFWMTYTTIFHLKRKRTNLFYSVFVTFLNDIHNGTDFGQLPVILVLVRICYFFEWHTQLVSFEIILGKLVLVRICYFFEWHTQLAWMMMECN